MTKFWVKSYGEGVPAEINPAAYPSVLAMFDEAVQTFGNRTAFHCFGAELTFSEYDKLATDFAAYLQNELGVKKGDRVAVMCPNIFAFPVAFYGIIKAGAAQVNVNPLYTPRELEHQLNDAGVETIVIFSGSTPTLAEIVDNTSVKNIITAGLGDFGNTSVPSPAADDRLTTSVAMTDAVARGAEMTLTPVELGLKDTLFLQYTGGTTGLSKGAVLSHGNLVANVAQFKGFAGSAFQPGDERIVTALPLYHIFALMVNFISYFVIGGTNWLVTNPRELDNVLDALDEAKPTAFTAVNTLFNALVASPRLAELDLSNIRICVGGGAAVHASTSEKWKAATGQHIREGYGLSETAPLLTVNPFNIDRFSGFVGLPVPSTDIILLDENDNEVGIGEEGEICAKGPQVMSGYWNRPDANEEVFTKDGYFRTGDIGVYSEEGYLAIVDRKKDMIIVSGFNVYPNEIEETVSAIDGVAECACVGVAHEKTGEAVRLFVVAAPGADLTEDAIVKHCRANLAAYKVPHQVEFIDELPKSTVGKILRRELRDA